MPDGALLAESAQLRAEIAALAEQLHHFATDLRAEVLRRAGDREEPPMPESTTPDDVLARRAELLRDQVADLTVQVRQLNERAAETERRGVHAVYALIFLGLVLLMLGTVVWQQQRTAARLEQVVQHSICPVYGLVLGGYDPETRAEGDARRRYEAGFVVMRDAFAALNCTTPLVPPREEK